MNVFREVEHKLKQINPDQPTWKKRNQAWRLLYDEMLPLIRSDIHQMPRLREIINERMRLLETYEAYQVQQPVNVGEMRKILTRATLEYARKIRELKKEKSMTPEVKFTHLESVRSQQEKISRIQTKLANLSPNQMIYPRKIEKAGMQFEWFRQALQFQLHSFETLVGEAEAKHIRGSEEVFRTWLRTQKGFRDGENDRPGRGE